MGYRAEKVEQLQQSTVVTLSEAKLFIKEDRDIQDDLIESLIRSATNKLQEYTSTIFTRSSYKITMNNFEPVNIPYKPLDENTISISYKDKDGNDQTLGDSQYDIYRNRLTFEKNDGSDIEVTFDAGYTDQTIPHELKTAIKLLVMVYYQRYLYSDGNQVINPMNHPMIRSLIIDFKVKHF